MSDREKMVRARTTGAPGESLALREKVHRSGLQDGLHPPGRLKSTLQRTNSSPGGRSGFGGCARRRWRGGPGGNDGRWHSLQGVGRRLWCHHGVRHHRGWRTRHQAQGTKQGVTAVRRGGRRHRAIVRQHHLEHARTGANHQFCWRMNQGRGHCRAKRQGKPQHRQFGEPGCSAQGLQNVHSHNYDIPTCARTCYPAAHEQLIPPGLQRHRPRPDPRFLWRCARLPRGSQHCHLGRF